MGRSRSSRCVGRYTHVYVRMYLYICIYMCGRASELYVGKCMHMSPRRVGFKQGDVAPHCTYKEEQIDIIYTH